MKNAKDSILNIFKVNKPIIGMLHLEHLVGKKFKGIDSVIKRARDDIKKLQDGGIDGIIIENWKEDSTGEFVSMETASTLEKVCEEIVDDLRIPFGINVLNNDYKVALNIAKKVGASFVELDVLVDEVVSDFTYNEEGLNNPFEIKIKPADVFNYAKSIGVEDIPVICFVQPKHYKMLDQNKTIEMSVKEAEELDVAGILVTKATGTAPTLDLIERAKNASSYVPVGIGSGFSIENVEEILPLVDYVVVGSSVKIDGKADNEVDQQKVKELMDLVKSVRKINL